jgi:tetraacyldisaccharide 4'-kinase
VTLQDLLPWLLWPLTLPYGAFVRFRAFGYRKGILKRQRLVGAVVSVGNLTTGGTGKTPMVLWIAQRALAEGGKPTILTRGYRGRPLIGGPASDEAQLLAKRLDGRVPLGVGANRFARGAELSQQGFEWFILDDGFQHLQLARDVDIVLIDATNPFGGGHLLPTGRLREPRSALSRADIVVITRSDHAPALETIVRRYSGAPVFYARTQLDSIRILRGDYPGEEDTAARSRRFFVFCGLGNPSAFLADVESWGLPVVGHEFFPDHHFYMQHNLDALGEKAHAAGADALLCSEKDVFNLAGVKWRPLDVHFCRISMRVGRPGEFWRTVTHIAQSRSVTSASS